MFNVLTGLGSGKFLALNCIKSGVFINEKDSTMAWIRKYFFLIKSKKHKNKIFAKNTKGNAKPKNAIGQNFAGEKYGETKPPIRAKAKPILTAKYK